MQHTLQKLTNLAQEEELAAENALEEIALMLDIKPTLIAYVNRNNRQKGAVANTFSPASFSPLSFSPLSFSYKNKKVLINIDEFCFAEKKVLLLQRLIQLAKKGMITFIARDEITSDLCALEAENQKQFSIACNTDSVSRPRVSRVLKARMNIILLSKEKDFSTYYAILGTRKFLIELRREIKGLILRVGEEIMEQDEIHKDVVKEVVGEVVTVRAVIGSLQVPLEELLRLRKGSVFNLGAIESVEAIFEVAGNPYATGKISILDDGNLVVTANSIL